MNAHRIYGIEPGQVYALLDGSPGRVIVRDVTTLAEIDDIVVFDEQMSEERRIGAYTLARGRYYLVDYASGDSKSELLRALREGDATPPQQRRLAALFKAQQDALAEQLVHASRGRFFVDNGEWRYLDDEREGMRTWLSIRVANNAHLGSKGSRADALDAAMKAEAAR